MLVEGNNNIVLKKGKFIRKRVSMRNWNWSKGMEGKIVQEKY